MAFVVITHLHPEHESHLAELLQRQTPMPAIQVRKRIKLEAGKIQYANQRLDGTGLLEPGTAKWAVVWTAPAASGNVMLVRLAITIRTALLALFRISSNVRASYENSLAEHHAVALAIGRRSPEQAEQAMRQLLRGTVRDLEPAFRPRASSKRKSTSDRRATA